MSAGIFLVSACGSAEEFVAAFRRYADRTGLFVPLASPLPQGRRGRIALTLKDGGVMLEGEAEIVQSSTKSPLHGRAGIMLKFVDLDEPSKTVLAELEKARLAMKPAPPTVPPRPADVPAEPRPVVPAVGGRIDAANALAECVAIGDVGALEEVAGGPPKAGPKFVVPSIPAIAGRPKSPTTPPEGVKPDAAKPAAAKAESSKAESSKAESSKAEQKMTTIGMPAIRPPGEASGPIKTDPTPASAAAPRKDPTPVPTAPRKDPTPVPTAPRSDATPAASAQRTASPAAPRNDATPVPVPKRDTAAFDAEWDAPPDEASARVSGPAAGSHSGGVPAAASKSGPVAAPASKSGPVAASSSASKSGPVAASSSASKSGPVAATSSASHTTSSASKSGPVGTTSSASNSGLVAASSSASTSGPVAGAPPTAAATPGAPSARPDAPKAPAKAKMTQIGFPVVKPPAESGPRATTLGVVPLRATDAPSGAAPVAPKPPEMVPAAPKLPDAAASKPPLPQPTPTRSKSPTAPPRHPTPFAPLPVAKLPAKPAPALIDADVDEKTDLSSVPIEPDADSAMIESRPPMADPAPPRPARSGGMRASEIMAAVHAEDWTMTPDASGPTVLPAEKPMPEVPEPTPGPGAPPTGDWTMSLDPAAGWGKPEKVDAPPPPSEKPTKIEKRTPLVQTPATGNPVKSVSSDRPIDIQAWEDKPTSIGAKIEIDATLMEPLDPMPAIDEDLLGGMAAASASGMGSFPVAGSAPGMPMMPPQPGMPPYASPYADAPPAQVPNATGPETAVAQSLLQPPPLPLPPPPGVPMSAGMTMPPGGPMPPGAHAGGPMPQEIPIGFAPTLLPGQMTAPPPPMPPPMQYATAQPGDLYRSDAVPVTPPRSNKKLVVIVASALVVVALAVVLAMSLGGKKKHIAEPHHAASGSGSAVVVMAGSGSSQTAAVVVPEVHGSDGGSAAESGSGSATQQVVPPPPPPPKAETCKVDVATTPAGAEVSLEDKTVLGTTPGTFQLPCGTATKLKIQKAKYLGVVRQVTPTATGTKLAVTLGQGTFAVKITSSPAGATITVGGRSKGVTPAAVQLPAFQTVTITLSKEGYGSDSQKVVIKTNGQSHHVVLRRAVRSHKSSEKSHGLNGI